MLLDGIVVFVFFFGQRFRHCMKSEFLYSLWQRKESSMPLYGQL